jgi:5-dehydro-2-deoxygluconokinase
MNKKIIKKNNGFDFGLTKITSRLEQENNTMMDFGILKLKAGDVYDLSGEPDMEYACILLDGKLGYKVEDSEHGFEGEAERSCIFNQDPTVINISKRSGLSLKAQTNIECAIVATDNTLSYKPRVYNKNNMLESDKRGFGVLNNTAYRVVRTAFDKRNHPDSNLVVGEVINFPGCWSSYPPHYHVQPEIYHYRFTEPDGYGHAELGEEVLKVRNYDTVKILDQDVHSQVSAPGYGMYYIWLIRHLENNPYTVPTFVDEHAWTKDKSANERVFEIK